MHQTQDLFANMSLQLNPDSKGAEKNDDKWGVKNLVNLKNINEDVQKPKSKQELETEAVKAKQSSLYIKDTSAGQSGFKPLAGHEQH